MERLQGHTPRVIAVRATTTVEVTPARPRSRVIRVPAVVEAETVALVPDGRVEAVVADSIVDY